MTSSYCLHAYCPPVRVLRNQNLWPRVSLSLDRPRTRPAIRNPQICSPPSAPGLRPNNNNNPA